MKAQKKPSRYDDHIWKVIKAAEVFCVTIPT